MGKTFFKPASVILTKKSEEIVTNMGEELQEEKYQLFAIEVEGHTDNVPINTARFPSNWELSSLRAVNVAKLFESMGVKKNQLSAIAYADTRPKQPNLDSNGTAIPENQATNRRVVVHVKSLTEMKDANNN